MAKLDRLGWAAGIAIVSHGARIGIRTNDSSALERVLPRLPPGWKPSRALVVDDLFSVLIPTAESRAGVRKLNLLYGGATRLARSSDPDEVFRTLESELHFSVAMAARRYLFVHAGVVAWRGQAILLPGRSMAGKSRLVEALVRAGATYYSDEYAVIDAAGKVRPYAKRLSIRGDGVERGRLVSVHELGGRAGSGALPVRLIAVAPYLPGAEWRPRRLSQGQALMALLDNTVTARYQPEIALQRLALAVAGATSYRGARGESADTAAALLAEIGRGPGAGRPGGVGKERPTYETEGSREPSPATGSRI